MRLCTRARGVAVQRLLDDGHELEAERIQRELEKRAEPYFRDLNRLGGRVER